MGRRHNLAKIKRFLLSQNIAILILELFYNAKKKQEFLLIFEAIFPISVCQDTTNARIHSCHTKLVSFYYLYIVI
jgi:hypothetical protein